MLSPSKAGRRGHLQQIGTGEGKTAIVALFVVVKALRDGVKGSARAESPLEPGSIEFSKIDVVTSSDALARRDSKGLKTFYGMFGLTVDNCTGGISPHYKECYAADILYGDSDSFQGDILCHEFKSMNVRGTPPRPFECIVIDEVDCMLVDDMMQVRLQIVHSLKGRGGLAAFKKDRMPKSGMCCCCNSAPAAPPPPSSCCGRRKRQGVLSELMEWERRVSCCTATGRKRRAIGAPVSKRLEFWALNHLGPKMF
uniref:Chloroplast protein-transporting ATPase n=1 Tax=Globodera pallida TaxID=36090 RepID=A0A183CQF6_GLOPA